MSTSVSVRLIGEPGDVIQVADAIRAALAVYSESRPYPSRGVSSRVRLYLEVHSS